MKLAAAGVLLLSAVEWSAATTEREKMVSRFQIDIPYDLYREKGYPHQEASFGTPEHAGTIATRLVHGGVTPGASRRWTLCTTEDAKAAAPILPAAPFILMVDRGECTYVAKARRAQELGAIGVIIADDACLCSKETSGACWSSVGIPCEQEPPIVGDDGSGGDIHIPSFLIEKMDAALVRNRLQGGATLMAEMAWSLAAPEDSSG